MDDTSDPRELSKDTGDDYEALTDEEIDPNERLYRNGDITREEYEILLELESKKKEILENSKLKRKEMESVQSPLKSQPSQPTLIKSNESANTAAKSGSTSYFVNMLEQSRAKQVEDKNKVKSLLNSRIYTFGKNIEVSVVDCDELEQISGQQISKRYIQHSQLLEFFKDIKVLRVGKAMAKIAPPKFEDPRYPNWCCVGILSSKSSPRTTANNKGRFIIMSITDFKYVIDVYIFGNGVEKYNKLRIGDVIAILNPEIFIKRAEGTESFAFSVKHSMDCILEIGKAKNFGHCVSVKADGSKCGVFINKTMDSFCEYHKELRLRKTASKRMEFQQSYRLNAHVINGVQQAMYLGKPDSRHSKLIIAEERGAPKTDRLSRARVNFSSDGAHRAFFTESKVREEMFESVTDINKKKLKEKTRADRLKEIDLQRKLANNLKEGRNLSKVINIPDELDISQKKNLLSAAFNKETLSNLGFDPTSKSTGRGVMSYNENGFKSDILGELRSITKEKKIDLTVSKEELVRRRAQRDAADKMIKRLKTEKKVQPYIPPVLKEKPKATDNGLAFSDSSDEELEIEDTPFSKFKRESTT